MDPFQMPKSFCVGKYLTGVILSPIFESANRSAAQTVLISLGAFIIGGVAMAFTVASYVTSMKPKTWGDSYIRYAII